MELVLIGVPPNMALQRTRRPRFRSGRSLRSLGSPLNARSLGGPEPMTPALLQARQRIMDICRDALELAPQKYPTNLPPWKGPLPPGRGMVGSPRLVSIRAADLADG